MISGNSCKSNKLHKKSCNTYKILIFSNYAILIDIISIYVCYKYIGKLDIIAIPFEDTPLTVIERLLSEYEAKPEHTS